VAVILIQILNQKYIVGFEVFRAVVMRTLKMEAMCCSETSVAALQITRRHIPEDDTLQKYIGFVVYLTTLSVSRLYTVEW
jgi:hypothetical protein